MFLNLITGSNLTVAGGARNCKEREREKKKRKIGEFDFHVPMESHPHQMYVRSDALEKKKTFCFLYIAAFSLENKKECGLPPPLAP